MGTTLSHLQNQDGMQVAFVLLIEGMPYAITTSADTAGCVTALAATSWSTVYSGLTVRGTRAQSIEPWQREFKASELIFTVQPVDGSSDVFGVDVHKTGGGSQTELRASIDCDDTTIPVMDHTNLSSPVWIGTERITYTGTSGTAAAGTAALTGATRGTFSPFDDAGAGSAGNAGRFGRNHAIPTYDYDVKYRTRVTTSPRVWIGRRVECRAFRIVGTTWDVYAQSHRVFAGTIKDIQDLSEGGGQTQVICEDIFSVVNETTLLHDQFRGRVKEGSLLRTGMEFQAEEKLVTTASPPVNHANDANDLNVAASDSFPNQIAEGYYTASDLIARLNDWLADERNSDGTIDHFWSFALVGSAEDPRVRWRVEANSTAYVSQVYKFRAPRDVLAFLGFDFEPVDDEVFPMGELKLHTSGTSQTISLSGARPPLRTLAFQGYDNTQVGLTLELESSAGTWFDNTDWLPPPLDAGLDGTGWGLLQIGNSVVVGKYVSDTEFESVFWSPSLKTELGDAGIPDTPGVSLADGGYLEARQIVILDGSLTDIIARIFASTGTAGYNHTTYDAFPAQLGCAIPWDLLGDDFTASLSVLEQDSPTNAIRIVLEKPTTLAACVLPEMLLRGAFLVWKSGGLRFTQWATPVGAIAIHTLTEANKGSAVPDDPQLAPTQITAAHLRNVVKVEYNRKAITDGAYRDTYEFKFTGSISDYGVSKPFTVEARNSYAGNTATGDTVQELAASLIGKYVPMWGVPIQMMQRTINTTLLEDVAPGDIAIVTDEFMRDPSTGLRGVTDKPALIVSHECHWWTDGELYGRVTLAFLAIDNVPVYSPAAIVDATTYAADTPSAGKSRITAGDHNFSYPTEDEDWTHFSNTHEVTVYEYDDPGGSPQSWNVTMDATPAAGVFTFDANLTGIDTTGATKYVVVSRKYADTASTQKSKAFMASSLDLRIQDARDAYEYGHAVDTNVTINVASTALPSLIDTSGIAYADGAPVTPIIHDHLGRLHENFVDYKSAVSMPVMVTGTPIRGPATTSYRLHWCMPYFAGIGYLAAGLERDFSVAPMLDSTTAAVVVNCRITLSMSPPRGSSLVGVTFSGPYRQLTFTHQSTTAAVKTAQDVQQVVATSQGWGYLTVELGAASAGSSQVDFMGISEFQQGPRA